MNAVEKSVRIIQFSDPTHRYSSQAPDATLSADQKVGVTLPAASSLGASPRNKPSSLFPALRELQQ